ncbi:MAG TPA: ROK family transcriptional regulator [Actinocrinis sp.]|nr:ROK family transcriptional regulator [Actinocrinis sp.]
MAERVMRTVRDLRRSNRSMLLRRLYFDGPLSRQDLIDTTTLSAASVSNVIGDLINDGLVAEVGSVGSDGGRPRILLRVDGSRWHAIGVDVGETRVLVELFTLDLAVLARAEYPLPDGCGDVAAVVERIDAGLRGVLKESGVDQAAVAGVGVGVPGVVARGAETGGRDGVVVHGQTIGWDAVPLERLLREAGSMRADMPLFIDNGATTLGQAEMWFGAGRGTRDAVFALIGSGVGACVVADGSPYRGTGRSAGEWGHTTVQVGGRPCRCGARGCLEAYVGAEAVIERYREAAAGSATAVDGRQHAESEESALAAILAADARGDEAARAVLEETAVYLGVGVANLINLFNPERIALGGWAGLLLGARLLPRVREIAGEYALRHAFATVDLSLCELGPDAVARGAATLPVAGFLNAASVQGPALHLR